MPNPHGSHPFVIVTSCSEEVPTRLTPSKSIHQNMESGTACEINRARCPTVRAQMILVFHGEYDRQATQCAFAMELRSKQCASTPFDCAAPMVVGRATASSTLEVAMNQSDRTRCGLSRETEASKSRATSRIVTAGMTHAPNLLGRSKGSPPDADFCRLGFL